MSSAHAVISATSSSLSGLDSMLTSCGGMEGMLAKFGEEIGTQEDTAS